MRRASERARNADRIITGVIAIGVCSGILVFGLWCGNFIMVPGITPYVFPDHELQPTAIYLAENPDESSNFAKAVPPAGHTIHFLDKACVYLSVITFWERGEDSSELVTRLMQNTVITVDSVSIQAMPMQLLILANDPHKGFGPGPLEFCFAITLGPGVHLFQLVTEYPEDEVYKYSWSWVVGGN